MSKKITIEFIYKEVRRLDTSLLSTDEAYKTAVVLLSSLSQGPNVRKLARFTGYQRWFVQDISDRMRKSKLWGRKAVYASEWFDKKLGAVSFWLDVSVAMGHLKASLTKAA